MNNNIYGIDLGTCNFKIFCKSTGEVLKEKNTIAVKDKNTLYAYGDSAYEMYEKAPEDIRVIFPVVSGVIAEFDYLQKMIFDYLESKMKMKLRNAEFVVAIPTAVTKVEERAFYQVFKNSKSKPKNVLLCKKPIAAAVGLGLDVNEPTGIMLVDIGAETTEISVISLGGIVSKELVDVGGNKIDEDIVSYIRKEFNLVIGKKTGKALKESIGSALPPTEENVKVIVGRDVVSGLPIEKEINSDVVYEAMQSNLTTICNAIKVILEKTPPELAKDIIHSGIYVTGGSSMIQGLDKLFEQITNIKINTADNPEDSVVRGLVEIVSDPKYKSLTYIPKEKL
ncbi:rod shape-determining protein [Lachnobacterium bovis]|uniref:Cell shape-determining protein MreB n=1 Tax=Lachnobacterium bovis TaxID=140626 RepID=A0A1H9Q0E0_9FIRM|nr:rod shape-determining protein [Lachnobacterium bovis]SER53439.1 rod shape-determining protein MreB [Lachnobacterium bovis]